MFFGTWRTLQINREGQITERFSRAIEHLGHPEDQLDIRLGGIYALERIARDSESDRGPIIEVLTAFLREHARWAPGDPDTPLVDRRLEAELEDGQLPGLRADLQAAATVLGRNRWAKRHRFHLPWVDLLDAQLYGAHLQGSFLYGAHLERALLSSVRLEDAFLIDAHLEGTFLGDAHLEGADLTGAHLEGADLTGAHLEGADLTDAHLEGAIGLDG